eukprot:2280014-Pyramimonas_sp.AAC.1
MHQPTPSANRGRAGVASQVEAGWVGRLQGRGGSQLGGIAPHRCRGVDCATQTAPRRLHGVDCASQ